MYLLCFNKFSYIRVRELIKEILLVIGIDLKGFSFYSLRVGGVIFIVKNLFRFDGFDRLFMFFGCWRFE